MAENENRRGNAASSLGSAAKALARVPAGLALLVRLSLGPPRPQFESLLADAAVDGVEDERERERGRRDGWTDGGRTASLHVDFSCSLTVFFLFQRQTEGSRL